jgi:hypothetical protein
MKRSLTWKVIRDVSIWDLRHSWGWKRLWSPGTWRQVIMWKDTSIAKEPAVHSFRVSRIKFTHWKWMQQVFPNVSTGSTLKTHQFKMLVLTYQTTWCYFLWDHNFKIVQCLNNSELQCTEEENLKCWVYHIMIFTLSTTVSCITKIKNCLYWVLRYSGSYSGGASRPVLIFTSNQTNWKVAGLISSEVIFKFT